MPLPPNLSVSAAAIGSMLAMLAGAIAEPPPSTWPEVPPAAVELKPGEVAIRVATFNIEDVRTEELTDPQNPRLRAIAEILQRIRPNVVLINEIAYDVSGAPGVPDGEPGGRNAQRFIDNFLAVPQQPGLQPLAMRAFFAPSNTGQPSGKDLNNDGVATLDYPAPGKPGEAHTAAARAYGEDCWGFGTFPGQYAMALLVDSRLEILTDQARTFRLLPWDYMPGHSMPGAGPDETAFYSDEERAVFRLSSKSHWDVPVRLPGGAVVHFLCSHPTPPVFDGPEDRNGRRNRDEIRFWADYLEDAAWIVDDAGKPGGLAPGARCVVLGDLNADPAKGDSLKDPIGSFLLKSRRLNPAVVPKADREIDGLDPADTALFKLRVDYVIPSRNLGVAAAGVWRHSPEGWDKMPSDHFPVWMDLVVPPPPAPPQPDSLTR